MSRILIAGLFLFQLSQQTFAADELPEAPPSEEVQSVTVDGVRNPELRTYRSMLAGLDEFEKQHHMAPKAGTLRFYLKPKHAGEALAGVTLRIAGGDVSIPVPIAPDGSFVLPRNQAAADGDADLILNRPKKSWSGRPLIRSAGVPANMRRLGDIRLECQVAMAIGKSELNFMIRAAINTVVMGTDWCQSKRVFYGTDAPYPSDAITLVHGDRRVVPDVGRNKNYFYVPLNDPSWPDDTLIEFTPSAPPTVADFSKELLYVHGSMNKWKPTQAMEKVDASNFRLDVVLAKGINKFRIATKNYRVVELGASDSKANEIQGNFKVGEGKALAWTGRDVWFEPPQAGTYTFALNVTDPKAPVLTITPRE